MEKYKLTNESIEHLGRTLYRIEALKGFGDILKGDKGGYIEKEENLSQDGNAWVFGDAEVYSNARVYGDAWVSGNARVFGDAEVYGDARVFGNVGVSSGYCFEKSKLKQ